MTPANQDRALAEFFEPFSELPKEPNYWPYSKTGGWIWNGSEWMVRSFTDAHMSMKLLKWLHENEGVRTVEFHDDRELVVHFHDGQAYSIGTMPGIGLALREAGVRAIGKWEE